MKLHNVLRFGAAASISLLLLGLAATTRAQTAVDRTVVDTDADRLKLAFLACERGAMQGLVGVGDAAKCSQTYEALKSRAFGGDFHRLLAWWREQDRTAPEFSASAMTIERRATRR